MVFIAYTFSWLLIRLAIILLSIDIIIKVIVKLIKWMSNNKK